MSICTKFTFYQFSLPLLWFASPRFTRQPGWRLSFRFLLGSSAPGKPIIFSVFTLIPLFKSLYILPCISLLLICSSSTLASPFWPVFSIDISLHYFLYAFGYVRYPIVLSIPCLLPPKIHIVWQPQGVPRARIGEMISISAPLHLYLTSFSAIPRTILLHLCSHFTCFISFALCFVLYKVPKSSIILLAHFYSQEHWIGKQNFGGLNFFILIYGELCAIINCTDANWIMKNAFFERKNPTD